MRWADVVIHNCLDDVAHRLGIMLQYGGASRPQDHGSISCGDIMGGVGLASTSLLAVYQQRMKGYAGEGRISLARAMNFTQLPWMIMQGDSCEWGEPTGQFALGENWHQRLYQCLDRWLYVHTTADQASQLGLIVVGHKGSDEGALERAFRAKPVHG